MLYDKHVMHILGSTRKTDCRSVSVVLQIFSDRAGGMVVNWLTLNVKIFISSSLITMQNLVAVHHIVRTYVGHKNLGCCGTGARLTYRNTPFPHVFPVPNFVTLKSEPIGIGRSVT